MHVLNDMGLAQTTKPTKTANNPSTPKWANNPEKGANYFPTPKRGLATPPTPKKGTKSCPTPKNVNHRPTSTN